MAGPLATAVALVLALSGAALCGAAVVVRRRRSAPATDEFAVTAAVAGIAVLTVSTSTILELWLSVFFAVITGLVLPVPWLAFALEYTGRSGLYSKRTVAIIATPLAVGVGATVLIFGSRVFPWLTLPSREAASGLVAIAVYSVTITEWITLLYAGGLMLVGTGILLWTFQQYDHLDPTSGILLGVFGSVPWLSLLLGFQFSTLTPLGLPVAITVGFSTGAVATGATLYRRQLFETLPAAGNIGPATVIEELGDVVFVTDSEGTVIERNAAAGRLFDDPATGAVESDITELLNREVRALREADTVELKSSRGRRVYDPTVSELTDQRELRLGYAIVLRDVTDRAIRRQRLEVLNRVLRHNLRNDTIVVRGRAEILAEHVDDPELIEHAETIARTGTDLMDLAETAREAETLLASADTTPRDVHLVAFVDDILTEFPDARIAGCDIPGGLVVRGSEDLLRTALSALVEYALTYDDADTTSVTIRASFDHEAPYPVTVVIEEDGPGIPATERNAVQSGVETPLEHGTGVGLWLVRWAVTRLGGELTITDDERGTTVSIRLPEGRMTDVDRTPGPTDGSHTERPSATDGGADSSDSR